MTSKLKIDDELVLEVIQPPKSLLNCITRTSGGAGLDMGIVTKAEKALDGISNNFAAWMTEELAALIKARDKFRTEGSNENTLKALFYALHNIRGQAATFGFPLAGEAANSLCNVLEKVKADKIPQQVFDYHLDSIAAIIKENATNTGSEVAQKLIIRLCEVTDEFIERFGSEDEINNLT